MPKKIIIMCSLIIFGTIFISFIKNKTKEIENQILILNKENEELIIKLKNEKLENDYLSSPEKIKELAKKFLPKDYVEINKSQFKYLND